LGEKFTTEGRHTRGVINLTESAQPKLSVMSLVDKKYFKGYHNASIEDNLIEHDSMLDFDVEITKPPQTVELIQIYGDSELQEKLRNLCMEYGDVFGRYLYLDDVQIRSLAIGDVYGKNK
jgi:hypothetical protein